MIILCQSGKGETIPLDLKDQELPEVRSEKEGGTSEAQGIFLR